MLVKVAPLDWGWFGVVLLGVFVAASIFVYKTP
jgi:hypothetical protein